MVDGHTVKRALRIHEQIARIWADPRFPPPRPGSGADVRVFAVTVTWVIGERVPRGERAARVCELLHLNDYTFWEVIRADLPRYEPPRWEYQGGECAAPMVRRDGVCGRGTCVAFRVTDPADGTWRMTGYCTRHRAEARAAELAERAREQAGMPEPLPNAGGLLPCYIGGWNWEKTYAIAAPSWEPPQVGICADDWPVMTAVAAAAAPGAPELRVHPGGGQQLAGGTPAPSLRLVPPPGA